MNAYEIEGEEATGLLLFCHHLAAISVIKAIQILLSCLFKSKILVLLLFNLSLYIHISLLVLHANSFAALLCVICKLDDDCCWTVCCEWD